MEQSRGVIWLTDQATDQRVGVPLSKLEALSEARGGAFVRLDRNREIIVSESPAAISDAIESLAASHARD